MPVQSRETILISSCGGPDRPGDGLYNGGVKIYNAVARLLRSHGYDAYVVTYDGSYTPWLAEYEPYISLATAQQWKADGRPLKFITGWLNSPAFLELAGEFYYYDNEVLWTMHYKELFHQLRPRIRQIAITSQMQRAWYAMEIEERVHLIGYWFDERYWKPDSSRRVPGKIGYMKEENPRMEEEIDYIWKQCVLHGHDIERPVVISGSEIDVIRQMQTCDIYLGLSKGKHPVWGEGGPAQHVEAMLAGCVVVAYDTCGNHEYLHHGYNGFVVPRGDVNALTGSVLALLNQLQGRERMRQAAIELSQITYTSLGRWPLIQQFLEL